MFSLLSVLASSIIYTTHSKSFTNSSGQYFISLQDDDAFNEDIVCTHQIFCYFHIIDITWGTKITTHSTSVSINCSYCNRLKVFSDADNFAMIYTSSSYGRFHLENVNNIEIYYESVQDSTLYAQYASNVKTYVGKSSGNVFYLDNVSNNIHFICDSNHYSYCSDSSTISAANANQFNLTIPHYNNHTVWGIRDTIIYCPYHNNNVCNFELELMSQMRSVEIFIPDMNISDHNTSIMPLRVYSHEQTDTKHYKKLTIWCQENEKTGIYQSNTDIYYDTITNRTECSDIESSCCYLKNHRQNIFCPHHDICTIDCNKIYCINNNIYSSNSTTSLNVICNSTNCHNTIINCPTKLNTSCNVTNVLCRPYYIHACDSTVIRYNTNNIHNDTISPFEYKFDYLQIYYKGSLHTIHHCDDGINCDINLNRNDIPVIIYANYVNSLSISCINCSFINIYANNASIVTIKCVDGCHNIRLNGIFVKTFNLQCSIKQNSENTGQFCDRLDINVMHAKQVYINAVYMSYVVLYAINASNASLICRDSCNHLELLIPLSTIICDGNCDDILLYSANKKNVLKTVTICDYGDYQRWKYYCPSPINRYAASPNECTTFPSTYSYSSKLDVPGQFCECDEIRYVHALDETIPQNPITIITHNPFSSNCRGSISELTHLHIFIQTIIGLIYWLILFIVFAYYLIICAKYMYFKSHNLVKYTEMINDKFVKLASKTFLCYIYCCDVCIWLTQIYIVTISWILHEDVSAFCDEINSDHFRDDDIVCEMISACSWYPADSTWRFDHCRIDKSIWTLVFTISVTLSVAVVDIFVALLCTVDHTNLISVSAHFVCVLCGWTHPNTNSQTYHQYYLQRKFFKIKGVTAYVFFITIWITRYLIFFIPLLILCKYDFGIQWFDFLPVLVLILVNEMIKIPYTMLSSYDKFAHIKSILIKWYGEDIADIILMFLPGSYN
eukprot:498119_1